MTEPYLHIYSQEQWHGNAYVAGNEEGLKNLRDAIDVALKEGKSHASAYVSDGEGFYTLVVNLAEDRIHKIMTPYQDEIAQDSREDAIPPWELDEAKEAEVQAYDANKISKEDRE
jgi:hypothetical protein